MAHARGGSAHSSVQGLHKATLEAQHKLSAKDATM